LIAAPFSFSNLRTLFKQRMKYLFLSRFSLLHFVLLSLVITAFSMHKFYVSKTIIEYNARTQLFEITTKIFTDDLDKTLSELSGRDIRLGSPEEYPGANNLIEDYMKQHFSIEIDGVKTEWRWVGKETENDLTFCYMEIYRTPVFSTLKVHNDLLVAEFPEQQNIVDLTLSGTTQTQVFFKDKVIQTFQR
jgi:hypothetical protein